MANWDKSGKVRMTPKGTYDPTVPYEVLDIVKNSAGTKTYISKKDVPANTPLTNTTYWVNLLDITGNEASVNEVKSYLGIH